MRRYILIVVGLVLATGLSYVFVLRCQFVNIDDDLYVYDNNIVRMGLTRTSVNWAFTTSYLGNWHPLTWLSLELDHQLFGLSPPGYHATSLLLHVANTVLLFWLLLGLTGAAGRSACAAAFFGLHPLHVESVAWISERKDVLSTFFLLLSILAWQAYTRRAKGVSYALALVLFLFSLMSKAMCITLPLVLLLLDFWPLARVGGAKGGSTSPASSQTTMARLVAEKLPLFLVSGAFAAVSVLLQGQSGAMAYGRSLTLAQRLLIVPVNYVTYLGQVFWPVDLVVLYPHPGADLPLWKPLAATLLLLAITAAAVRLRKSLPYVTVGWFWFLITLLPVIGFVQLGRQATADRYMYLPIVGPLIILCWGGYDLTFGRSGLRWTMAVATAALLFACAELTSRQVRVWENDFTLWQHALAVAPPSSTACGNYGRVLLLNGEEQEAERQFRQAIEIDPMIFAPNYNMGILMGKKGRHAEAAVYFERALASTPDNPFVLDSLGMAEEQSGKLEAAREHYERALEINPQATAIRNRLERLKERMGEDKKKPGSSP